MEQENPTISLSELNAIEKRIKEKTESLNDYERLNFYLSAAGANNNIILTMLKEKNVFSYAEFISERKKTINKNPLVDGYLFGYILGVISSLKDYVSQNKLT